MHVAICDDNIADRKQTERLLDRQSDARSNTTGVLYIDSFGDSEALLQAPMIYDIFFIDMTENGANGIEVAQALREAGVTAPIVMVSSKIRYKDISPQPYMTYFIDKPVRMEDLSDMINMALQHKEFSQRTIEIRNDQETRYVLPGNIVYAEPAGHLCNIVFENGEVFSMRGGLADLFYQVEYTDRFLFAKPKLVVNLDFIRSVSLTRLSLKTGRSFPITPMDYRFIKKFWPEKS